MPSPHSPAPAPTHLQIAGGRGVVDLDIAVVGARQQLTVSKPRDGGTGVGKYLACDVHLVPLPRVHGHGALQLGGICKEPQCRSGRPRLHRSPARPVSQPLEGGGAPNRASAGV